MEELITWTQENGLDCQFDGNLIFVKDFGTGLFIGEKEDRIISDDFLIILDDEEAELLEDYEFDFAVFKFGSRFYYTKVELTKNEYNELSLEPNFEDFQNVGNYIGEFDSDYDFVNLGVHTGYELLNGSSEPINYIKRAKFLRQKYLAICDLDTLGGTLSFQLSCQKSKIIPIIGESISVAHDYIEGEIPDNFDLKLYVKNKDGWRTLLNISKVVNVDHNKFIPLERLLEFKTKDLICVISTKSFINHNIYKKEIVLDQIKKLKRTFGKNNVYYQIDLSEFTNDEYDADKLNIIKKYMDDYSDMIKPVYIQDTYYVNKTDNGIKKILNEINKKSEADNRDCYLKSIDDIFEQYSDLFSENDDAFGIFIQSIENTSKIAKQCDFEIEIGKPKIPKYKSKNPDLYFDLIQKGLEEKILTRPNGEEILEEYIQRVEIENEIIIGAEIVDYFLILWDIIDWCKKNNILVGVGRGSAGGSLVAYLLGITEIDPIEYGLLFERFLNKTRTMPEIKYEVTLENGSKFLIPEKFYNDKIKGKKDIDEELIKEFSV